jgi:hypothetical protein
VISHPKKYKYHFDSTHKYLKVAGIPHDNTFVVVDNQVFQQSVGIPMGTNCAPLFIFI